ncbi:MAG: TetR family transcriptional regulator [Planctomycetes bacterium]|nr:TetR family transcriptional regulator [Planctomycetota bacterium]
MTETGLQRRDEVLSAAERLFAEHGYQATSVRDIADVMDLQAGSLYAHIESKDDLLWDIVTRAADGFFEAVQPIVSADLVPMEKLRRLISAHVQVITANLDAASVYSTEWRHLAADRKSEFAKRRNTYEKLVRGLVRDCIREGTFADVDEKFATLLILSSINWIYQWYRADGPMTPEEIARKLTDLLFNGLRRS